MGREENEMGQTWFETKEKWTPAEGSGEVEIKEVESGFNKW
jgi:hypothetical protein